jgi:integrase
MTAVCQRTFYAACARAGVKMRFYDARHTLISRLAEDPNTSDETIRQLAGHVSPRMLRRYAHIGVEARRRAIASLEARNNSGKANGR